MRVLLQFKCQMGWRGSHKMSKQTWPLLQEQAHRIFRTNLIGTAQQGMIHGSRDMLWGDMLSRCAGLPTCAPDIIYNMGSMQERGTGIIVGGGDNTPVDVGVHWAGSKNSISGGSSGYRSVNDTRTLQRCRPPPVPSLPQASPPCKPPSSRAARCSALHP